MSNGLAPELTSSSAGSQRQRIFSKRFSSKELFEEAYRNSHRAWEASLASDVLETPQILRVDVASLTLDFEYRFGWRTVNDLMRSYRFLGIRPNSLHLLFQRIGRGLAELHRVTGHIHGDFDTTNILFEPNSLRVCFVDFSRPDFDPSPDYNRRSIYRDLALFCIFVRVKYPPHKLPLAFRPMNRVLSREFFRGYETECASSLNLTSFEAEWLLLLENSFLSKIFVRRFLGWSALFSIKDLP